MKPESGSAFWLAIALSALLHAMMWLTPKPRSARAPETIIADRWAASSVDVSVDPARPEAAAVGPSEAAPPPSLPKGLRPQTPRPAARTPSESARSSAATTASATATATGPAGSLGALELPPGVRHLAHAFTRALPASNYTDATWTELPSGLVGRTELELTVDEEGHLGEVTFDPRSPPAAVIEKMVRNALLLLKAGVFSIDARKVSAGTERLSLEVSLRDEPSPLAEGDARGLFRKSYDPPSADHAGRAGFTLNSGRHMEAVVRMLPKR